MKIKKLIVVVLSLIFGASVVGCGTKSGVTIDPTRTQIYISVYDGGHGTAWIEYLAAEFEKKYPIDGKKYQIIIEPEKRGEGDILSELNSGRSNKQAFVMSPNAITSGIYKGVFEDVSDIAARKVDGENGGTIKDKMMRFDEWSSIYSKYNEGLYALPYADSMMGFLYDHQLFDDMGWYNYAAESDSAQLDAQGIKYTKQGNFLKFVSATGRVNLKEGDRILSCGKDGKFGTYDDGQAVNMAQWDTIIDRIVGSGAKPFIWGGSTDAYTRTIVEALFAQYEGEDNYNTYFNYDSGGEKVRLHGGEDVIITLDNGYRVNEMEGQYKAFEFMSNYFNSADNAKSKDYLHGATTDLAASHTDAQNNFLLGHKGSDSNPRSAMILDGAWFEYESQKMAKKIGETEPERGYGKRDYRYMLFPDMEGQKSEKSCFSACESGVMVLAKDANTDRLRVTKDFFAYVLSDESLRYFTRETGSIMPYRYELTDADRAELTPFTKNMIDLYYDEENITIVRPQISSLISPLSYASSKGPTRFSTKIGVIHVVPSKIVKDYSMDEIFNGMKKLYTPNEWSGFITQAKNQGFYK